MATRKKTIRVPINLTNSGTVADATLTTLGTPTIYIAENSVTNPVTFVSCMCYIFAQDMSTVTGGTIGEFRVNATLNGAGTTTITELDDFTHTGENWGTILGPFDFTAHFTANFGTVASKTCQTQVYFDISTGTTTTVNGVYGYWELTYTYNDAETLRIETVCIPMESILGALTTTANTAYCTLPQLTGSGGWLNGYASPVIRHIWCETRSISGTNAATTAQTITHGFNGVGGGAASDSRNNSLASDTYQFRQFDLSGLTFTGTNTIDLWSSVATRYHCLVVNVFISFQYTVSGSTRVLNYVEIPLSFQSKLNGTTSAAQDRIRKTFVIPEPGTITQRAIGVHLEWTHGTNSTLNIGVGSQTARAYAEICGVTATAFQAQHLGDSRSGAGSGVTLARGINTIDVHAFRSAGEAFCLTGFLKILYESDVASAGIDTHSHTVFEHIRDYDQATSSLFTTASESVDIPEASYWIHGVGLQQNLNVSASAHGLEWTAEVISGEGEGDGWRPLYCGQYNADSENNHNVLYVDMSDHFRRYPSDPGPIYRLNVETGRTFRFTSASNYRFGVRWMVSYHSIPYTISGNVYGSSGGTVSLRLYAVSNNQLVATTTRSGDGSYSFTVYDNVDIYYVQANETSTQYASSKTGVPATDFNVNLTNRPNPRYQLV